MSIRVLHVVTVSESLRFLGGQLRWMRERGFEPRVVTSPGPFVASFSAEEEVPVDTIDMPRAITPLRDAEALTRLVALIRRVSPDIVHAHTPKAGLLGTLAASIARTPVRIYHMRGLPMRTAHGIKRTLLASTERVSCGLAHEVLCVSPSLRRIAIDERLVDPAKIRTLGAGSGNGVDARVRFDPKVAVASRAATRAQLGIPADALVFGFVGRLVRDKGIAEIESAFRVVREKVPNAWLLLCGPEDVRDAVDPSVIAALRRGPRTVFTGYVEDVPSMYGVMDVVMLPSYREGFPNVVLEAGAMGLPVVATSVEGCVDAVVGGVTGSLIPVADGPALSDALIQYAREPGLRAAHGAAARARVLAEFDRTALWEALEKRYHALLERYS